MSVGKDDVSKAPPKRRKRKERPPLKIDGKEFPWGTPTKVIAQELNRPIAKISINGRFAPDTFPYGKVEIEGALSEDQWLHLLAFTDHISFNEPFDKCLEGRRKQLEDRKKDADAAE